MAPLPNAALRRIPRAKIIHYLLDADHPQGGSKAKFFIACGFHPDLPDVLEAALMAHAVSYSAHESGRTPYGRKFNVEGVMAMPNGRPVPIRAVWMVRHDGAPDLVTAYPI